MYARQRTALRCYLRRLLGCFRHSGRSQRPEYRRAFRKTLRLHAVLRIALIHTRQRTALRCYLRRLAPLVRPPPQPPKIDFVDNSRASAKCSSENRAGRSLDARRPAVVRECSHASHRRLRPEYRCTFHKTGVTPARSSPPPHRGGLQLAQGSFRPPPSANSGPADPKFASEISKNPLKTRKIAKKACKLLYDTIICTTFGASDPSKDVNRIAATEKVEF